MKLKEWIIRKITIRRLFKAYGKRLYQERINYVKENSCEGFKPMPKNLHRMSFRRTVTIILVLVIVMASAIASAVQWEIKPPIFSFVEKEDHSEVHVRVDEGGDSFLNIGYIPEGYEHVLTDNFQDITLEDSYKNENDEYLYITQDISGQSNVNISNEECSQYEKIVDGIEIHVYDYTFGKKIWLFVKDDVYISISGYLSTDEMILIVESLEIPA